MRVINHLKKNKLNIILILGLLLEVQIFILALIFANPLQNTKFAQDVNNVPESLAFTSNIYLILFVIFLQPALEELMFRWHITSKNSKKRNIFIASISAVLVVLFFNPFQSIINFLVVFSLLVSISLIFLKEERLKLNRRLLIQIIITSIAFSFSHGGPLSFFINPSIAGFSFILLFTGSGFLLSYLRVNYGLIWAILFHFTTNAIMLSYSFYSENIDKTPISFQSDCYTIEVAESGNFDNKARFSINYKNLKWKTLNLKTGLEEAVYFNNFDVNFFDNEANLDSVLDNYSQKKQFRVYQVDIQKKDSCKIRLQEILDFLEKEKLMVRVK